MIKTVANFSVTYSIEHHNYKIFEDTDTGNILISMDDVFYFPKQENCDCESFYLNEVKQQLEEGVEEIYNGWKTCLYGVLPQVERARKIFTRVIPRMRYFSLCGSTSYWYCIEVTESLEEVLPHLEQIFERKVTVELL